MSTNTYHFHGPGSGLRAAFSDARPGDEIGVRKSSAQLTIHYTPEALVGRQVAAVVNFPPRQIGKFMSEILVLGFPDADGAVVLLNIDQAVPNGGRLF